MSHETVTDIDDREARLDNRFQVRDCPSCGRTTVVDSRYDEHRCDWVDTCDTVFDLDDADLSDSAFFQDGTLVRVEEVA